MRLSKLQWLLSRESKIPPDSDRSVIASLQLITYSLQKEKRDKNLSTKSIAIIRVHKTNRQVKYVYRKYSKETVSK